MITKVRIKNFASIKDSGIIDLGKINVLIGQNASGKSNFINALTFTRDLSRGQDVNDIFTDFSTRNLFYCGTSDNVEIFIEFIGFNNKKYRFKYQIELVVKKTARDVLVIPFESLEIYEEGNWNYLYRRKENDLSFTGQENIPLKINNKKLLFSYFEDPSLIEVSRRLKSIFVIKNTDLIQDLTPYVNSANIDVRKLNHLAVELSKNKKKEFELAQKAVKKIIPYFSSVHVEDLKELFSKDESKMNSFEESYLVFWRQTFSKLNLESRTLSSGDQRTIFILFAMFYLNEGATISVEEIENGIHIGRVSIFLDQIRTLADNRNLQIIISTHSKDILNHIFPKEVIFCKLSKETGTTYQKIIDNKMYQIVEAELGENASAKDYFDSGYF